MTKFEVLELIKKKNLSQTSNDYIAQILRNFDDKEVVTIEKLEAISKIILAEEQINIKC